MYNLLRRSVFLSNRSNNLRSIVSGNLSSWQSDEKQKTEHNNSRILLYSVCGAFATYGLYKYFEKKHVHAARFEPVFGEYRPELPSYTMEEVSRHDKRENRIWVVYKEGVYDITDFALQHPGGTNILLAAGGSVEPFWMIYGIHKTDKILKMLEEMRIGNISPEDAKEATRNMEDPYSNDPRRHPILKPASLKPFNAEPLPSLLVESYHTPNDIFYVRNHLPVPNVDPKTYELEIEIEGKNKTTVLTLDQIKKLPKHSVTAAIMCAGNRRSEMIKIKPVKGLSWGHAAVGNAVWSGPRLRDVLLSIGVKEDDPKFKHVQLEGLDTDPTNTPYAASIPIRKAMDKYGDVILAYEMNGEPLSRDHGFPIRAVVPGTVGARNVKWLGRIYVSEHESPGFWQQNDYKGFSPSVDWDTVDFKKSPAIQQLPVISAICVPQADEIVEVTDGHIMVKGYAWSGGGQKIVRVDLTTDGGKTWHVANIDMQDENEAPRHWGWTLWSCKIPVKPKTKGMEIWVKAVDSSYNTQPESFENIWNLRGVLNNAYHRVSISVKQDKKIKK